MIYGRLYMYIDKTCMAIFLKHILSIVIVRVIFTVSS